MNTMVQQNRRSEELKETEIAKLLNVSMVKRLSGAKK
jgi:hypothetical protein